MESESQNSFNEEDLLNNKSRRQRAARKIVGEWPDEKVFLLISIVEQRPTLWNVALPDHKQAKDLVIISIFNISTV